MSEANDAFMRHLTGLFERGGGPRAVLRRSLAFPAGSYPPAYPYVERFAGTASHAQDGRRLALYAVAGLFALHPRAGKPSLASCLGQFMRSTDSASVEKRFIALLGADAGNALEYLRQAVTLLSSKELALNYSALVSDLTAWLNPLVEPDRLDRVRQRWARDFYRALSPAEPAPPAESTEPSTSNLGDHA